MTIVVAVVAAVVFVASYLTWTAGRIDRMHVRVEAADAALDAQLVRRAAAARELAAHLGHPGWPARSPAADLGAAARRCLEAGRDEREAAESALSRALRSALAQAPDSSDPRADPQWRRVADELSTAALTVGFARRFHNDAVRDTLVLRSRRVPRWFRLAGHAPLPRYFDIDETATSTRPP